VLSKIPKSVNNELWRLFSGRAEVVEEAISHYQENYRKSEYSILMQQLYEFYIKEKLPMTYTLEQFKKDFIISHLREIPTEEVLKLIQLLYEFYVREKLPMTYTLEQFKRDFVISYLRDVPTEWDSSRKYATPKTVQQYHLPPRSENSGGEFHFFHKLLRVTAKTVKDFIR